MKSKHIKRTIVALTLLIFCLVFNPFTWAEQSEITVIPKPVKVEILEGEFILTSETKILVEKDLESALKTANYLAGKLKKSTGFELGVSEVESDLIVPGNILLTSKNADKELGKEGYELEVKNEGVIIRCPEPAGFFYGTQTLLQLLPPEVFSEKKIYEEIKWSMPCVKIRDYPRFKWRGMHLDVSRHFFDVEFVKTYIDRLAMHKINVFHWHLTDDEGWRIEVKKYPKLTSVGAWRGSREKLPPSHGSGSARYGGYYTQDEIREVVQYASERYIDVLPEIDVPAHSKALLVSYPQFLCSGDVSEFRSIQGIGGNVLCAGKEETYEFLEDVMEEVIPLFPFKYFHIGADEVPEGPWEQCESCQKRIKKEKLWGRDGLQDYFLTRMQSILKKHNKKMIGWYELKHSTELDKDYVVMAWTSSRYGVRAAEDGYRAVMVPYAYCYFDLVYELEPGEPGLRWGGEVPTERVYSFKPEKKASEEVAKKIIGVHGCLWSETLINNKRPYYMAYPRVCALAEVAWTPQDKRDYKDFSSRMAKAHFSRMSMTGINYRIPPPKVFEEDGILTIELPYEGAEVRYTISGTEPRSSSKLYTQPFQLPEGKVLKMRTFVPDGRSSRIVTFKLRK